MIVSMFYVWNCKYIYIHITNILRDLTYIYILQSYGLYLIGSNFLFVWGLNGFEITQNFRNFLIICVPFLRIEQWTMLQNIFVVKTLRNRFQLRFTVVFVFIFVRSEDELDQVQLNLRCHHWFWIYRNRTCFWECVYTSNCGLIIVALKMLLLYFCFYLLSLCDYCAECTLRLINCDWLILIRTYKIRNVVVLLLSFRLKSTPNLYPQP